VSRDGRPPHLRLALINLHESAGGISEFARLACEALAAMAENQEVRLSVQVLNESAPAGAFEPRLPASVPVFWCGGSRLRFARRLAAARAELVLFDHIGPAQVAYRLPGFLRPPYAVFIHGVELGQAGRPGYVRALCGARHVLSNSECTRQKALALGVPLPPVEVCHLGLRSISSRGSHEHPVFARLGRHTMLIVGRMSVEQRHKGHDHLIDCLPHVRDLVPDAQLVIAGEGDDRERLQRKAAESAAADGVLFAGKVGHDVLHGLYERCALYVMPSTGDGFGFVYLEAMAHARACVGLAGTAAAEIILAGKTGLLVDREDPRKMGAVLGRLLADEDARRRMGDAGKQRLQATFTARHFEERFQAAVRQILSS